MHIAFLTLEYPPGGGGIATSLAMLAPALVRRGHDVTVVGWGPTERREKDGGVRVRLHGPAPVPKLGWWLQPRRIGADLRKMASEQALDVVVAHDWCGPSARVSSPCPLVVWCNGSATYFGELTGEPVRPSVRRSEARALRRADAVAAASAFTGKRTQRLFGLEKAPATIHNPVDVERFQPAGTEVDAGRFIHVGTVVRKKGVLDLCRAFNRVVAERPRAQLLWIGRDSRDARTGAPSTWELCRNELSDEAYRRVDYRGFVAHDQLRELVAGSLAAVLPSFAEAFPLTWLEAMSCARPVLGYDHGWAQEAVRSGEDGVLVKAGDTNTLAAEMIGLLDDPGRADRFGSLARERMVAELSADAIAIQFERWLEPIVGGAGA